MILTNFDIMAVPDPHPWSETEHTRKFEYDTKVRNPSKGSNYLRQGLKKVAAPLVFVSTLNTKEKWLPHCFVSTLNTHPRKQMIFGHKIHATSRPSTKHLLAIVNTILHHLMIVVIQLY